MYEDAWDAERPRRFGPMGCVRIREVRGIREVCGLRGFCNCRRR